MNYYNPWNYRGKKPAKKQDQHQRIKYGQTWWGKEWLNSLAKIDFENRLPRGRAYAGNGSVLSLNILKNRIKAKVDGSMPWSYEVRIDIPVFSAMQKEKLLQTISGDPFILSKLLNREVPQELGGLALDAGIKLFPSSWKDINMECSCPDFAVPCKHIAAVIYLVSQKIDANPFILFTLHDMDLPELLKGKDLNIIGHEKEHISEIESMIVKEIPESGKEPSYDNMSLPDFSVIHGPAQSIFSMLPVSSLFFQKDFRDNIIKAVKNLENGLKKISNREISSQIEEFTNKIRSSEDTLIIINDDFNPEVVSFGMNVNGDDEDDLRISFTDFVSILERMDPSVLANSNKFLRGIELHRQFALALGRAGTLIPSLLKNINNKILIRWIPPLNDQSVCNITKQLQNYAYPGTMWIKATLKRKKEDLYPLSPEENSLTIISLFLNHYLQSYNKKSSNTSGQDSTSALFFNGIPLKLPEDNPIPNTIQLWLKRLHISHKSWILILKIEIENGWFLIDFKVKNSKDDYESPVDLRKFLSQKKYESFRVDVLRDLVNLADLVPEIVYYIQSHGKHSIRFDGHKIVNFVSVIIPMLNLLGIETMMPKNLAKLLKPAMSLKITSKNDKSGLSFINLNDLLDFEYQVAIGEELITVEEFRKLVGKMSGLVKIRDQYVLITDEELEKLFKQLEKPVQLTRNDLLKTIISGEFKGQKVELTPAIKELISEMTTTAKIKLPSGLKVRLRQYQLSGYRWLLKNTKIGFGSLIADDMGLGKTAQVIATILMMKQEGNLEKEKVLVIVPTTLITNWVKEVNKFAPELKTFVYHGNLRNLTNNNFDILITTYGTVRSDTKKLGSLPWKLVIIDEAQNIKNPGTAQSRAIRSLSSEGRIAMTGTPVENRLAEYRSIMDFLNPGYLGSEKVFEEEFVKPVQNNHDHERAKFFRKITAPFILRRMKTDRSIIQDLPEKIENNHFCGLTTEQASLYQNILDNALEQSSQSQGINRRGIILKMITSLKQICNHPDNFLKKGSFDRNHSGKSLMLFELLDQIRDAGEKVLIFTQYKEMGDILAEMIRNYFHSEPLFLHGGVTRLNRDKMVESFQENQNKWIFILSLKAGGTGLNLTGASHVIHYDLWWNPAVEAQATDRAYRIGQVRNVIVSRLITKGTFEEKIDEMLKSKKKLADLTVETGETWIGDLPENELKELFRLTREE